MRYTMHFLMGWISIFMFLVVFIQMWTAGTLRFEGRQKNPWLSNILDRLLLSKNWSFLATPCFTAFGFYLFYATLMGNIKFGLRFFSLNFYPMVPRETFVNSFVVNAFLMNVWMYALIYELVDLFR